jgi:integrase
MAVDAQSLRLSAARRAAPADIDTALVLKVLEPIWHKKPETASRLRGRIESVLDFATVRGHRAGDNPARWRGHLEHMLASRTKLAPVKHREAMPYVEVPSFIAELRQRDGTASLALEFTILTTARTAEVLGAEWTEIDLAAKCWSVPPSRMKAGKPHRVPLSARVLSIIGALPHERSGRFLFIGSRARAPLSDMAMLQVLRRMGRGTLTVHGFRSSFRDWAAERTNFPREVIEMALAHVIENKAEAAYFRSDLWVKRAKLMEAWSNYCARPELTTGADVPLLRNVLPIGGRNP